MVLMALDPKKSEKGLTTGNNKSTPGPKFDPFDVDPNDPFDVDKHRHVFYSDVSIIL